MHQKPVGLVAIDHCLRVRDQFAPLVLVARAPLQLGKLVIVGIVVADEVEARLGGRGMEKIVDQLVRIAALRPPNHAPHRGIPAFALVPHDLALLLARHRLDLDIETELAPGLRDQLRRLKSLRRAGLRIRDQHDLADAIRLLRVCCTNSDRHHAHAGGNGTQERSSFDHDELPLPI